MYTRPAEDLPPDAIGWGSYRRMQTQMYKLSKILTRRFIPLEATYRQLIGILNMGGFVSEQYSIYANPDTTADWAWQIAVELRTMEPLGKFETTVKVLQISYQDIPAMDLTGVKPVGYFGTDFGGLQEGFGGTAAGAAASAVVIGE